MEQITIAGETFTAPTPYAEGHTLDANEASALNQLLHENLRNNFAKKVKDAKEAGTFDLAAFQAQFDQYADGYKFGVRTGGGGGRTTDPVKREAMEIAVETVKLKLKAKGKTIGPKGNYTMAQVREAAGRYLEAHPEIMDEARARVEEAKERAAEEGDDLDSLLTEASAAPEGVPAAA